jgi:pyridoxamine 5'-phosphate oxidase
MAVMSRDDELLPDPLPAEPMGMLQDWVATAALKSGRPNPNAMVLATASHDARPAARVVLCKGIVSDPGYLVFYTNYDSHKGQDLANNPRAAAVFHWDSLHRQLRIEGRVVRSPPAESDAYFNSRPWGSRLGAWASEQSRPIASRAAFVVALARTTAKYGAQAVIGRSIPRPDHWGGFRLWAEAVEFWAEGQFRIHDRVRYTRALAASETGFTASNWSHTRLQP